MKKILSLLIIAGFATLIACGPSAEEKAAADKARMDSIAAVAAQDSMMAAQAAMAEMEKHRADSLAMVMQADSIAKAEAGKKKSAPKPKPVPPAQQKKEEAKKVHSGRGH